MIRGFIQQAPENCILKYPHRYENSGGWCNVQNFNCENCTCPSLIPSFLFFANLVKITPKNYKSEARIQGTRLYKSDIISTTGSSHVKRA